MESDVAAARAACDLLVVSCHWGIPGDELCDYQQAVAHQCVQAGADIIMGHGPHSVQGVEIHQGRPILYSLGNLAFDWPVMAGRHLDGLIADVTADGTAIRRLRLHPVRRGAENDPRPLRRGDPAHRDLVDRVLTLSPGLRLAAAPTEDFIELLV